jgi:hypothetical protein
MGALLFYLFIIWPFKATVHHFCSFFVLRYLVDRGIDRHQFAANPDSAFAIMSGWRLSMAKFMVNNPFDEMQ